jgi:hypothetical protein
MGRLGRSDAALVTARTLALASSIGAPVLLWIDFAGPAPHQLDVATICVFIVGGVALLAWLLIHLHNTAAAIAEQAQLIREHLVATHIRTLKSDSDHR